MSLFVAWAGVGLRNQVRGMTLFTVVVLVALRLVQVQPVRGLSIVDQEAQTTTATHTIGANGSESEERRNTSSVGGGEPLERFARRSKASGQPKFVGPIANVTAILGRDVRLICTVENLGQYQVAWLKEETKTILSIDTNIIITNYRIFLIPDEEERKWVLHIKDVQESDRGYYQCQVNTNPMRSTSGYLEVVVPPTIVESQTSQVAEVLEHSNASIQCEANGHPRPTIVWRREDGAPIRLNNRFIEALPEQQLKASSITTAPNGADLSPSTGTDDASNSPQTIISQLNEVKSDRLTFQNVDRSVAGVYVCTASNGVQAEASKRVPLIVEFAPKTSVQNKHISVSLGDQLDIECLVEGSPKATGYWSKFSTEQPTSGHWSAAQQQTSIIEPFNGNWQRRRTSERFKERRQPLARGELSPGAGDAMIANSSVELEDADVETFDTTGPKRIWPNQNNQSPQMRPDKTTTIPLYSNNYHPHNRIHLIRQLVQPVPKRRFIINESPSLAQSQNQLPPVNVKSTAYLTVKQTSVDAYTYKLRMSIEKMQPEDYGKYLCVAKNPFGTAESQVIVTRASRISEMFNRTSAQQSNNSAGRSVDENDYQPDGLSANYQSSPGGVRLSSAVGLNRVTYDANYLQSIKSRQQNINNNFVGSNRLQQQKLKSRQFSERNSSTSTRKSDSSRRIFITVHSVIMLILAVIIDHRHLFY